MIPIHHRKDNPMDTLYETIMNRVEKAVAILKQLPEHNIIPLQKKCLDELRFPPEEIKIPDIAWMLRIVEQIKQTFNQDDEETNPLCLSEFELAKNLLMACQQDILSEVYINIATIASIVGQSAVMGHTGAQKLIKMCCSNKTSRAETQKTRNNPDNAKKLLNDISALISNVKGDFSPDDMARFSIPKIRSLIIKSNTLLSVVN